MAITRAQKEKILEELKEKIAKQKAVVLVDFGGLKAKDLFALRRKIKAIDGKIKVAKKTLIQKVLKESGIEAEIKKLKGEVALVFGFKDEISPAKLVWQFSQENQNLKVLGGILENKFIEAEKIIEMAKLPSKEGLLAELVGSISAPVSNFVRVLDSNLKGLVYILSIIGK